MSSIFMDICYSYYKFFFLAHFVLNIHWQVVVSFNLRDAISTTFLQYFHNISKVVNCYWFKFEPNTKITFLPQ